MFGSVLSVIVVGVINVGDVTKAFEIAAKGNRLHFLNLSPGRFHTLIHLADQELLCWFYFSSPCVSEASQWDRKINMVALKGISKKKCYLSVTSNTSLSLEDIGQKFCK